MNTNIPDTIPAQRQALIDTFLSKNSQVNLSAIRDSQGVYLKHIIDSLEVTNHDFTNNLFTRAATVIDIGTGGGFPLLPLALSYPDTHFHGLDARKKKTIAVQDIADQCDITNATLHRGRAEEHKVKYDIVTARGVAYADQLFQWSFGRTRRKGRMIWRKQFTYEEDSMLQELSLDERIMDFKIISYILPGTDQERRLYCLQRR